MDYAKKRKFNHDHPTYRYEDKGRDFNDMFDAVGKYEKL